MKVVVLLSGGLDSVTALHHMAATEKVVAALSFDYGAKHNARELPCAADQCRSLHIPNRIVSLNFMADAFKSDLLKSGGTIPDGHYEEQSMKKTVVPFRNGIFLSLGTGYAESLGADAIAIAAHAGDHTIYPDCREDFLSPMSQAMEKGTYAKIKLLRPFVSMDKTAIVRRGVELKIDYARTWSCYKGGALHCGTCGTCIERREAFLNAGVADPTSYVATPPLPPKPVLES
ncbi:MAG: 7-cyano-7-deazaguanine synthase QueC [Aliarcobacter sp.]